MPLAPRLPSTVMSEAIEEQKTSTSRIGMLLPTTTTDPAGIACIKSWAALPSKVAGASSSDDFVVYVARLYEGLALDGMSRPTGAVDAYRAALDVIPHARSATLLLAESLFAAGKREEAAALMQATLIEPARVDPWVEFSAGNYRFWRRDLQLLRAAIHS